MANHSNYKKDCLCCECGKEFKIAYRYLVHHPQFLEYPRCRKCRVPILSNPVNRYQEPRLTIDGHIKPLTPLSENAWGCFEPAI